MAGKTFQVPPALQHEWCTVEEACQLLGNISRTTLYKYCRDGRINMKRYSKWALVNRASIDNYVRNAIVG